MERATLSLRVLTPSRVLLEVEDVDKVRIRLADGAWLSIYPYHAPLIAETLSGELTYVAGDETHDVCLADGILRVVGDNTVEILTHGHAEGGREPVEGEFDRLARQLMLTLNAEPGGVLPDGSQE
ncbi:MAG: hypothetical protein ACP5JG_13925 [Anaerolineae bacterium]